MKRKLEILNSKTKNIRRKIGRIQKKKIIIDENKIILFLETLPINQTHKEMKTKE